MFIEDLEVTKKQKNRYSQFLNSGYKGYKKYTSERMQEKRKRTKQMERKITEVVGFNLVISIIALTVNRLSTSIQR